MKKKSLRLAGLLLISALSLFSFVSCDKDTYCYLDVTVIDITNNKPIPNAVVKVDMNGSSIFDEGTTDANGQYSTKFAAPAIFNVVAKLYVPDENNPTVLYYRQGVKSIRLKEGEHVETTVIVETDLHRDY